MMFKEIHNFIVRNKVFINPEYYFKNSEFDSPDKKGTGEKMNIELINKLSISRDISQIPFIITSGYRTNEHNLKSKGVQNSAHTKGLAVDIAVNDKNRTKILHSLLYAGFKRVGIAKTFIHVDIDKTKPYPISWVYDANNKKLTDLKKYVDKIIFE